MAEFLEVIEGIKEDLSNVNSQWESGAHNPRVSHAFKESVKYRETLKEAVDFLHEVRRGKRPIWQFKEAMTTSDFPLYFGDILDRSVIAAYKSIEMMWRRLSQTASLRDFRNKAMFDFSGPDAFLDEVINEKAPYPLSEISESVNTYRLFKRGRIFDISWETLVNDDLDVFQKVPEWFAKSATRTEERFHTGLYAGAGGPNALLFNAPGGAVVNGNLGTGVLNVNNLGIAIASMAMMVDPENNEPIYNTPKFLVVPPALEMTAKRILNSTNLVWQVATRDDAGAADAIRPFPTQNFLRNELELVVNPYLPLIDATGNQNTTWYLFASPTELPATEVGFLTGYEAPQVFIKAADQQRVGGGLANPLDGDFMTDNIKYKVRHILGGTQIRQVAVVGGITRGVPAVYASNGTTATITNWPDNTAVVEPTA